MVRSLIAAVLLAASHGAPAQAQAPEDAGRQAHAHLQAGAAHLKRGEADAAVKECRAAVALNPQSAAAHMLLGQAYLAQRSVSMFAEAKAELQQALDLDPTLYWARFYLARAYIDTGRNDRAKEELERGLEEHPNVPHFLSLLGEVNRKLGAPEASIALQKKTLEVDPAMTPAHYYAALAYMDLKNDDAAIRELEASIRSQYVAPEMYLTLGSLYAKRKRFAEAEDVGKKAIALDPSRSESYLNLGQLYNAQGASDKALAALRSALPEGKTFPTSPYYQQLQADIHFETGRAQEEKHRNAEAIQAYLDSLAFDPNRGDTHRRLAGLLAKERDFRRAAEHAAIAEKLGTPVDVSVRNEITRGRFESVR